MKTGKWIWRAGEDPKGYNLAAQFRRDFDVGSPPREAVLRITADSRYRVAINGNWINDGPGKAYPEQFTYDVYDIRDYLTPGLNRIHVIVRHYGIGTFHQIVRQAGLLAEMEIDGTLTGTDASWEAAPLLPLRQWVPKVSIQMEPCEWYDARLAKPIQWHPARECFTVASAPWQNLSERLTRPLTKTACLATGVHSVEAIRRDAPAVCVPVTQIAHPGLIEANHHTSRPVFLASELTISEQQEVDFSCMDWRVYVDGIHLDGAVRLEPGCHHMLFFCSSFFGHQKELPFPFLHMGTGDWANWQVFVSENCLFRDSDIVWMSHGHAEARNAEQAWFEAVARLGATWNPLSDPLPAWVKRADITTDRLFMEDYSGSFARRQTVSGVTVPVANPDGCCLREEGAVRIHPLEGCDIEICYDLGVQCCGYLDFILQAPAGTIVDLHLVEFISPEGIIQHTVPFNRNGLRFVASGATDHHLSLKRRSGRYLFLTIRNLSGAMELQRLRMIESTADVVEVGRFQCSDARLNKVWDACLRTLKMGMEDTFTDCSLYEQTLWIGDARNQALYAFNVFGGYDVSARSLQLGAQSLSRFPMVGCQVPSSWECLLPAWSFLWGMHVWEHYFHSGDREFLSGIFPAVMKNLKGAAGHLNRDGLFSGTFWNLLEWAEIDQDHPTVMHNSLLLAGALRAAQRCATVLDDVAALSWLVSFRCQLVESINRWWDPGRASYPDAVLEDGTPSVRTCQHNSALAIIAGVLPADRIAEARRNLLDPPAGMTRFNSPFAAQFLYEALEILDEPDAILESIRANYFPMIEAGATTVWETFPDSTCSPEGFPTRSHCHGWSCGPLQFFNLIILGIRQTAAGGSAFEISPWIRGLSHASGAMATPSGPVRVEWQVRDNRLDLRMSAPPGVTLDFKRNRSHDGVAINKARLTDAAAARGSTHPAHPITEGIPCN